VNDSLHSEATTVAVPDTCALPWRQLPPARRTTGRERRWVYPEHGVFKLMERGLYRFTARYVFPRLLGIWHPYCWLLPRRFALAVATLTPPRWPRAAHGLRILHLSDIHCGAFLRPDVLASILDGLMRLEPDLVAVTGDIVEGRLDDLDGFLPVLSTLARAPLGAWYCIGNHDYFTGAPETVAELLTSVGIRTLRNESTIVRDLVLGGIDDRTLGTPDWSALTAAHGAPHLLLAHNPDDFYEAERRGVALVLSGHTHGGQIRFARSGPILGQSRFRVDEGVYAHGGTMLVVSRGLGAVGLPWRAGAHPEAVLLDVRRP
jgi:hypothetical protein